MDLDYEKYKDGSGDFIVNGDGDLGLIIGAKGIEVDTNIAKIIFDDSEAKVIFVKNKDNLSFFEDLPEDVCEMFKDGRKTITIIEVTDENTEPNCYELPIEMKEE